MEIKYTRDGKKVAVLGKLNDETWIVQEIFVHDDGQELPCGENFTEKTLLDKPAIIWKDKHSKELQEQESKLKQEIEGLRKKASVVKRTSEVAKLINKITEKYMDLNISELDTLIAFLSGQITHIIAEKYGDYTIVSIIDALEDIDNSMHWLSFDGLKLISLFGCRDNGTRYKDDRTFDLRWRINTYRDDSGSWKTIHPCNSYEEAVSQLDNLLSEKDATEKLIQLKEKHKLNNPSQEKIKEYKNRCIESKKERVREAKAAFDKRKKELQELKLSTK